MINKDNIRDFDFDKMFIGSIFNANEKKLIVEAFNVFSETNMTPKELSDKVKELTDYPKDREIFDLENIIRTLEEKIEQLQKEEAKLPLECQDPLSGIYECVMNNHCQKCTQQEENK